MLKFITARNPQAYCKSLPWYSVLSLGTIIVTIFVLPVTVSSVQGQSLDIPGVKLSQVVQTMRANSNDKIATAKVRLDGRSLFSIAAPSVADSKNNALDDLTPIAQRLESIQKTLDRFAQTNFDRSALTVRSNVDAGSGLPVITINDRYLMTVTTLDAQLQGSTPERWGSELATIVKDSLLRAKEERQPKFLLQQGVTGGGILIGMFVISIIISHRLQRLRHQQTERVTNPPTHEPEAVSPSVLKLQQQRQESLDNIKQLALRVAQVAVWGGGTIAILGLFPYTRWLQPVVLSTPLKVFSIGLVIYVLQRLSDTLIDRLLKVFIEGKYLSLSASQRLTLRVSTVSRVSKSIISIILVGSGALAILSILGVDLVPLLAGAGIIGLAISFASQNILKDIINGFFILLEDHYAVGDVVAIGEVGGLVENMNLRITQLRNGEGRLITIPNSAITIVQNLSKEWSRADLTLEFSLDTDPDRILQILQQLADEIYQDRDWQPKILEQPEVLGIDAVKHNGLFVRIWIKTLPLEQWAVGREFRRRLKKVMDLEEIAIGMPQQSLSFSRSPLDEDNSLSTMKKLL